MATFFKSYVERKTSTASSYTCPAKRWAIVTITGGSTSGSYTPPGGVANLVRHGNSCIVPPGGTLTATVSINMVIDEFATSSEL